MIALQSKSAEAVIGLCAQTGHAARLDPPQPNIASRSSGVAWSPSPDWPVVSTSGTKRLCTSFLGSGVLEGSAIREGGPFIPPVVGKARPYTPTATKLDDAFADERMHWLRVTTRPRM